MHLTRGVEFGWSEEPLLDGMGKLPVMRIFTLCGQNALKMGKQHSYISDAVDFMDQPWQRCPECEAHEDLPLLYLQSVERLENG